MNKELINKYKKEFDILLAGNSAYIKFTNGGHREATLDDFAFAPSPEVAYIVINDKYVKYRCALAEGKTIQSQVRHSDHGSCSYPSAGEGLKDTEWTKDTSGRFVGESRLYRVKPDEPAFKVGDWVRLEFGYIGQVSELVESSVLVKYLEGFEQEKGRPKQATDLELWKPQPGELCWFYSEDPTYFVVAKFDKIEYNTTLRTNMYKSSTGSLTVNIAPFTNQLPTCLKENHQ